MYYKSSAAKVLVISLILILLISISIAHSFAQTGQIQKIIVKRTIYVYQGFLIVNDSISLPNNLTSLYYYYTPFEFDSIYDIKISPPLTPVIGGQYFNGLQGYKLVLNGQSYVNILTVYNYTIFTRTQVGYAVNMSAYPIINYPIYNGSAIVIFKFGVSTYFASSPNGTKEKLSSSGEATISYDIKNITSFNRTPLYFNFTANNPIQFPLITDLTREVQVINQNEAQITDHVTIEYVGFGESISQWVPPLLPGSKVVQVYDSIGNLTYQNGAISLRYPLESSVLGGTVASLTIVSKINLSVLSNGTTYLIYYNFLANNSYLIETFTLKIDNNYISNIKLQPTPDYFNSSQYIYTLKKVFPGEKFLVIVSGSLQTFIPTLNIFNQILFVLTIVSFISFFYIRYYYKAPRIEERIKVPTLKKYIELIESLVINNEEMMRLDEQLRKGTIKKRDYNIRFENLNKERVSSERELKKLSAQITKENPSLTKLLSELESTYQKLIKDSNSLKDLIDSYEQKRIKIDQYRRMYNLYMRGIQTAKSKIDSILSELRTKIE